MSEIIENIKLNFLDEFQGAMTPDRIASSIIVSLILAVFIAGVYRFTYMGISFSLSFALNSILIAMVTSVIIMTITTNLALSLGMVGALSIVRFRTAVKDPQDTIFLFWQICAGIMAGAGLIFSAIITNLSLGIVYCAVFLIAKKAKKSPYLIVVKYKRENSETVDNAIKLIKGTKIKSKTVSGDTCEISFCLKLSPDTMKTVDDISSMEGVISAVAISYNSDTTL